MPMSGMAKIYESADKDALDRLGSIIKSHHPELADNGVTIGVVYVSSDAEEEGQGTSVLKVGGYPAQATAKITTPLERSQGMADGIIQIDKRIWSKKTSAQKDALLDHEITHFNVKLDANDALLTDTNDRPKLVMRKHDRQLGWFDEIATRHGKDSPEVEQATEFVKGAGQTYLPGFEFTEQPDLKVVEEKEAATG